ncbi:MAG: 50S ribosomal protein L22 [Patescibacteria group bacterium]|jgi:large subunit ribosomal protein L22
MVQAKAEGKHLSISPRKLRLVAETVKGKNLSEALTILDHLPQKGARIMKKVVASASANATNNLNLSEDNLFLAQVIVNEGARFKRLDYSHGARFDGGMIQKRLSHLKVILEEKENKEEKKKVKSPKKAQKKKKK